MMIDELIGQGAAQTRLNEGQVRTALTGALGLMNKHADQGKLRELFQAVPGTQPMAASGAGMLGGGGLMGGVMKGLGGKGGGAMADAMAMLARLGKDGISQDDLKALLPIAMRIVQEKAGRDLLREVAGSIPGVGKMLGA